MWASAWWKCEEKTRELLTWLECYMGLFLPRNQWQCCSLGGGWRIRSNGNGLRAWIDGINGNFAIGWTLWKQGEAIENNLQWVWADSVSGSDWGTWFSPLFNVSKTMFPCFCLEDFVQWPFHLHSLYFLCAGSVDTKVVSAFWSGGSAKLQCRSNVCTRRHGNQLWSTGCCCCEETGVHHKSWCQGCGICFKREVPCTPWTLKGLLSYFILWKLIMAPFPIHQPSCFIFKQYVTPN